MPLAMSSESSTNSKSIQGNTFAVAQTTGIFIRVAARGEKKSGPVPGAAKDQYFSSDLDNVGQNEFPRITYVKRAQGK